MNEILEKAIINVLKVGAVEIRDLEAGEKPFLYASGNWGPGYVTIKSLVSQKQLYRKLVHLLASRVVDKFSDLDLIVGNVTGGMIPGWVLSEYLKFDLDREVPFLYNRGMRKKGGQQELVTGLLPNVSFDQKVLVVEELVNFAETTCNSIDILRGLGFQASHAACILFYSNPKAIEKLKKYDVEMIYLFTLPQLLDIAEKIQAFPARAILDYRNFLRDPLGWQKKRGLEPVKNGGTQ